MATKEEGFFIVAEDEINNENEMINVVEDEFTIATDLDKKNLPDDNWLSSGKPEHFIIFLTNEMERFPTPVSIRGNISKMEQALGQWNRLNSHISKALREDYDGKINVDFVDKARSIVERNIEELEDTLHSLDTLKKNKKQMRRRNKRGEEDSENIVKEAGTPSFTGLQVQISAFERAIVGALINGVVSGGKNIEELYKIAKKKYDIDNRQELAIFQILADFGYPTFKDRIKINDIEIDPMDGNGEWISNYYA